MENFYEILSVAETADRNEIGNAYKKLSKKYQKKLNKGDDSYKERLAILKKAYNVLNNKQQRNKYDEDFGLSSDKNSNNNGTKSKKSKNKLAKHSNNNEQKVAKTERKVIATAEKGFKKLDLESIITLIFLLLVSILFVVKAFG